MLGGILTGHWRNTELKADDHSAGSILAGRSLGPRLILKLNFIQGTAL